MVLGFLFCLVGLLVACGFAILGLVGLITCGCFWFCYYFVCFVSLDFSVCVCNTKFRFGFCCLLFALEFGGFVGISDYAGYFVSLWF